MDLSKINIAFKQQKQLPNSGKILMTGVLLFIFALTFRVSYVNTVVIETPIRNDALHYFNLAYNIVYNSSYSFKDQPPFTPTTYITPGYPLFLAWAVSKFDDFKSLYYFVLNLQAFISSLTVVLIYAISLRAMPYVFAVLAAILVSVSPHLVVASGYFLTETLFTFLLALTIFFSVLALQYKKLSLFILAGAVCALASLVRPALLLFPILLLVILGRFVPWRLSLRYFAALIGAMIIIWLPWQSWKMLNSDPNESNPASSSFALGTYPDLIYKNPQFRGYPYRDGDPEWEHLSHSFKEALPIFYERVKQQPLKYMQWYLLGKPKMFWQANNNVAEAGGPFIYAVKDSMYHKHHAAAYTLVAMMEGHAILVLIGAFTVVIYVLSFIKGCDADKFIAGYICASLFLYFTFVHMVLAPLPRYSYPVIPFAYLLASLGLYFLKEYYTAIYSVNKDE